MNNDKDDNLLKMHDFYAQEARHQRDMMWETAKWFVLILAVIFNAAFKDIVSSPQLILLLPLIVGYFISWICIILVRSFYRTNLIYITMLSKIEEEIGINDRTKKEIFRLDYFITWQPYNSDRQSFKSSEDFVKDKLRYCKLGMYTFISFVFFMFSLSFVFLVLFVLFKTEHLNAFYIILVISFFLLPIIFLTYRIKKESNSKE